jgi:hypothetical protein
VAHGVGRIERNAGKSAWHELCYRVSNMLLARSWWWHTGAMLLLAVACAEGGPDATRAAHDQPQGGSAGSGGSSGSGSAAGIGGHPEAGASGASGGSGSSSADAREDSKVDAGHAPDGAAEPSVARSCAALARATCAGVEACAPQVLTRRYLTLEDCVTIEAALCEQTHALPGVAGGTPEIDRLTAEASDRSCALHVGSLGVYTEKPGTLPGGANCVREIECASGICVRNGSFCGWCAAVPADSQTTCARENDYACAPGRICDMERNVCVTLPQRGQACLLGGVCARGLGCEAGLCEPWKLPGEACVPGGNPCMGVICDPATRRCGVFDESNTAGAPCSAPSSENFFSCASGLSCIGPSNGTATCRAVSPLGAACTATCAEAAGCIDGKCAVPPPVTPCN